jgi:signal transduction histidine kinase
MDTIIDGLLEFARGGTEPPTGAHAELRPILDNVVAELEPAATTAHAEVIVHPFAPQEVACTPAALRSVLNNLVGNAVEHSEEGTRTERKVSVRVKDKVNAVRIEVQDSGPGLPPGLAQRAFEPFVRLGATQRSATGIALATVRRIVEACGGRVGVRSLLHEGTCFWFEVPKPVARASP